MDERTNKAYRLVMQLVQTFEIFMEVFESPIIHMFDQLLWVFAIFFTVKYENREPVDTDYEIIIDSAKFIPQTSETTFIHHIVSCILSCLDLDKNPIECISDDEDSYLYRFINVIRSMCPMITSELNHLMIQSDLKMQLLIKRLLIEVEMLSDELIKILTS